MIIMKSYIHQTVSFRVKDLNNYIISCEDLPSLGSNPLICMPLVLFVRLELVVTLF